MELFQELILTVALSLLISFILAKLLSMASACNAEHESASRSREDVIGKAVMHERKFEGVSRSCDSESERSVRFVDGAVKVDEFEGGSIDEKSKVEEFVNEGCESPEVRDDAEIEVNEGVSGEAVEGSGTEEAKAGESDLAELVDENVVEESPERTKSCEIEIALVKDQVSIAKYEEVGVLECGGNQTDLIGGVNKNEVDDEDDWEGIERTELETLFGSAVVFVGSSNNADRISNLDSDVKMQLYGLHKVAIEGPSHEPQPMALKISARAKWNAWQRLGNMSPEVAMEQYITLLSRSIPGWMGDDPGVSSDAGSHLKLASDYKTFLHNQPGAENERKPEELKPCVEGCNVIGVGGQNSMDKDKQ